MILISTQTATAVITNVSEMTAYQYLQQEHNNVIVGGVTIELDQRIYTWTDHVYITIVAPSCNTNPNVVDIIGNGSCGIITIKTSKGQLGSYQLMETGSNTGIFTGYVTLDGTGYVSGITKGIGPTDGLIDTLANDTIQVIFTQGSASISGSAIISSPPQAPTSQQPIQQTPSPQLQTQSKIPNWIRGVFNYWSQGKISDDELLQAIQFLVQTGIIHLKQ